MRVGYLWGVVASVAIKKTIKKRSETADRFL
jgi:hypothetical protein